MSNNPKNPEQDQLFSMTAEQLDPGRTKPTDFSVRQISNSGGDIFTGEASPALIAESQQMRPNQPIPDRNYVPKQ